MKLADELKKLADLRQNGALTEQEFAEAKAYLLTTGAREKRRKTTGWLLIVFGILLCVLVLTGRLEDESVSGVLGALTLPAIVIVVGCYYAGFIKKAI